MLGFIAKLFDSNEKQLKGLAEIVAAVNDREEEYHRLSSEKLREKTTEFKRRLSATPLDLDSLLPVAFAAVREAGRRAIGKRHFDVQILAGVVLHQGKIAEQKTGEGKTLSATLPLYLNSLTGLGCHLITPNDYLSRHGAGWMGPLYHLLGVSVGVIINDQSFLFDPGFTNSEFLDEYSKHLRPVGRKEAYQADISYGTNNEFGFDYLRDNMAWDFRQAVQRGHHFAIVDEVDSILIDEARTPLIISAPAEESTEKYLEAVRIVDRLTMKTDFTVDEKHKTANLNELGIAKVENLKGVANLYEKDFETVHHIEQALRARTLFEKNRDYVVKDDEVIIVDEFTGRLLPGRRYSEGLHQAIEAKEGVAVQRESKTLATVSFQNYFRLYRKLAGMTGTAVTEAEEFHKIYKLDVVAIPTNKPMRRTDEGDVIYKTASSKYRAVVDDIESCYKAGRPVLVGTTSIEKNELLHEFLRRRDIPHEVLNAKQHEREALVIAQSGRKGAVILATNMAGRGVDIILGGDPSVLLDEARSEVERENIFRSWQDDHDEVVALGGLRVIGTERHESRRIDNQLRGRSGRQGDPGSSRFYLSLQDDLMRIFGGESIERLMDRLGLDENIPIENSLVSRSIAQAQKRVEGHNFDIRKHLVEYDDVMNLQRTAIYKMRLRILLATSHEASPEAREDFKIWFLPKLTEDLASSFDHSSSKYGEVWWDFLRQVSLQIIDTLWMEHLDTMDDLREGIGLRGYAGSDPLVEYKRESHQLFERMVATTFSTISERLTRSLGSPIEKVVEEPPVPREMIYQHRDSDLGLSDEKGQVETFRRSGEKVGRNDPCPCGAKKADGTPIKYKHCHGKNL